MNNHQTMLYQGVQVPVPVLSVDLHVLPGFSSRIVLYIENGQVKCDRRLSPDEHICALDTFIEMAGDMELRIAEVKGGPGSNSNS